MLSQDDLTVASLGPCTHASPLRLAHGASDEVASFVTDAARIAHDVDFVDARPVVTPLFLEKAGPRAELFFDPAKMRVGIVTCGGLSPGLNNVIRSLVLHLHYKYGVRDVLGFRYGYEGLSPSGSESMRLAPEVVRDIHKQGGSVLGLGRGKQSAETMAKTLLQLRVDVLFVIGGDGTLRGAHALSEELSQRRARVAVVGIPKTIDNDVPFVDKTFGFDTAVEVARQALDGAHTEALGARNGVGLVRLMGRDAGFVAAAATLASGDVNFCLVPEVGFELDGEHGLLRALEARLAHRSHALIVVAEGCGRALVKGPLARDPSGNVSYQSANIDVGTALRDAITQHFKQLGTPATLKYIDPSYMIRSVAANANDAVYCDRLARHAVHAGMAGKTGLMIGRMHNCFIHVPLKAVVGTQRRIAQNGGLWLAVTEMTGQGPLRAPRAS